MPTDAEIEAAKARTRYSLTEGPHHEHNDCIRIAYEWLDAQPKLKGAGRKSIALKHVIESWAGRYVSTTDVDVAAEMHPGITGKYPNFNLSSRFVYPNERRLLGISEAGKHPSYSEKKISNVYGKRREP